MPTRSKPRSTTSYASCRRERPRDETVVDVPHADLTELRPAGGRFMAVRRVVLATLFIAFSQEPSFAACTDAAIAATRAAADQACAAMGIGCTTAKSHGAYVSCVAHQAKAAAKAGTLPKDCKGAVVR